MVGTNGPDVLVGTKKADVIVAKGGRDRIYGLGGNDTICGGPGRDRIVGAAGNDVLLGQLGRDKLFGGAGRDRLLGGPANDRLAGGPGNDACLQGSGTGLRVGCERPALVPVPVPVAPAPVPVPVVPPPPPPGPELLPLTGILAIAYSDMDGLDGYSTGDVLIGKLVDTDGSPGVTPGDAIVMGKYPTTSNPSTLSDFAAWGETNHSVTAVEKDLDHWIVVQTASGKHSWGPHTDAHFYREESSDHFSMIQDWFLVTKDDRVIMDPASPSQPSSVIKSRTTSGADDRLIDVEIP